jgi:replicative DNA helicase
MSDAPEGRVPPHNLDAEASVLGGILLRNGALSGVLERGVVPDDFYHPAHGAVFEAMIALDGASQPIDIITVADQLKNVDRGRGIPNAEGMLADLAARVPTAENIGYYARIVHEKSSLRRMIAACSDVAGKAFSDGGDTAQFLDWAEGRVYEVASRTERQSYVSIKKLLVGTLQEIQRRYELKRNITGVPTEYTELDAMTAGFQPGELIVLAARPSMGKTALALNIAQNAALVHNIPVLIFSLEMSRHALVERLLCAEAKIDGQRLRGGFIEAQEWLRLTKAMGRLSEAPIFIDDSPAPTGLELRAKARRWRGDVSIFPAGPPDANAGPAGEGGLGLVMVDYLQMVRGQGNEERKDLEISEISRGFKALAKELRVPVVALSQLNRSVEKRDDKRPQLSDLRESGAIEQDADLILFIYRDAVYRRREAAKEGRQAEPMEDENIAEIIVGKQRNGPTGTIKLYFARQFTRFENLTRRDE